MMASSIQVKAYTHKASMPTTSSGDGEDSYLSVSVSFTFHVTMVGSVITVCLPPHYPLPGPGVYLVQ